MRPLLRSIAAEFCSEYAVDMKTLRSRLRRASVVIPRKAFMIYAVGSGRSQSEVARFLGRHPSTVNVVVRGALPYRMAIAPKDRSIMVLNDRLVGGKRWERMEFMFGRWHMRQGSYPDGAWRMLGWRELERD